MKSLANVLAVKEVEEMTSIANKLLALNKDEMFSQLIKSLCK